MGISISPASRWFSYSQLDRSGNNVMVADVIVLDHADHRRPAS